MRKINSEIGAEPIYTNVEGKSEQSVLIDAFNWYNYNCGKKEAKEFVLDYLKFVGRNKNEILAIRSVSDSKINLQFGWLARMLCLGFVPSDKTKQYIADKYKELLVEANKELKVVAVVVEDAPRVNIQDRIREKASEEAGEIEGLIDDFVTTGCKNPIDMDSYFRSRNLSSVVMTKICNVFIDRAKEIEEVIDTTDPQLKEGYSNFSKPELRRFKEFLDSIVVSANNRASIKPTRKKRKVKEKPASVLVSKLNYMKDFAELGLISVPPEKVVGALQLWTYNTKTKLLGVYNADNAKGLSVKGSTLQNYNEQTSIGKRLRKPEATIKEVMEAGKVKIKKILPDLSTKESNLTGRLNSDTIILRIVN
jgi:hypothetical protein